MPRTLLLLIAVNCVTSLLLTLPLRGASVAHEHSRLASAVDPTYSTMSPCPTVGAPLTSIPWLYGDGEFEAHLLKVLRAKSTAACTHVGYPGLYYVPAPTMQFRREVDCLPATMHFRATGNCQVTVNGAEILPVSDATAGRLLTIPHAQPGGSGRAGFSR